MGLRTEHGHAPPPGLAQDSKGFDLDDLGAAGLEDAVLRECLLPGAGGGGLPVPAAPEWGSIRAGLGKLLGGRCLHLRGFPCWPGAGLGRVEGGQGWAWGLGWDP